MVLFALGLLLLYIGIVAYTAWMLTHPPRRTYATALARNRPGEPTELDSPRQFETWAFRSRNLELPVWDIKGDAPSGPVVILIHGWADSRIGALARVPHLVPLASRILALDLPGHGEAPSITSLGTAEVDDILALIEHIGPESRPILHGWSLGAGIALAAAARSDAVAGVIAESPYRFAHTPARNVLRARGYPYRLTLPTAQGIMNARFGGGLSKARFDRAAHAARVSCPIMVLHGACDEVCPIDDGRAIARAANAQLVEIPTGRHNDLWTAPEHAAAAADQIRDFLAESLVQPAGSI